MNIDRCVCTGRTFADVLAVARREDWDADAVRRELKVGANCGLCRPYVREALRTGTTVFHEILTDEPAAGR